MSVYQIIQPASFAHREEIFETAVLLSIYPTVIFITCSAIAWKLWKGKTWYSLSFLLLCIFFTFDILIAFLLSYPIDDFAIFLFNLDLFICYPSTLLSIIFAGLIGRLCLTINKRTHL